MQFTEREVGEYQTPRKRLVDSPPFAIDRTPVTNAQFARFLAAAATARGMLKTSSSTGSTAGRRRARRITPSSTWTWKTPELTPAGRASVCRPKRNGSSPQADPSSGFIRGAISSIRGSVTTARREALLRPRLPRWPLAVGLLRYVRQHLGVDRERAHDGRTRFCIIKGGYLLQGPGLALVRRRRTAAGAARREIPVDVARPGPLRHDRLPLRGRLRNTRMIPPRSGRPIEPASAAVRVDARITSHFRPHRGLARWGA